MPLNGGPRALDLRGLLTPSNMRARRGPWRSAEATPSVMVRRGYSAGRAFEFGAFPFRFRRS